MDHGWVLQGRAGACLPGEPPAASSQPHPPPPSLLSQGWQARTYLELDVRALEDLGATAFRNRSRRTLLKAPVRSIPSRVLIT